jgi:hypothetical protein
MRLSSIVKGHYICSCCSPTFFTPAKCASIPGQKDRQKDLRLRVATRLAMATVAILLFVSVGHGQGFGNIVGTVKDPSGAVIPNASITVTESGKNFSRTARSDSSGYYVIGSLRPSDYNLTVDAQGFHIYEQKGVTLLADQTLTANVTMMVGAVSESVSITTAGELVDTSTSTLKQVIEQRSISELPLNGRNAAELSLLVAGTVSYPINPANPTGTFAGGALQGTTKTFPGAVAIVTNGSRQNQVSYQLDGGNNVDEYTNVNQPFPMPDALQEFSVQTSNYSAQYGQNAGGVVNVITKSGTNQYHGNAFEFVRNSVLNARPWHAPSKDQLKRNQFGGTFGGPILHDKTFFFGAYQQTIQRNLLAGQSASVPSATARASASDPAVVQLLKHIPLGVPTGSAMLNSATFFRPDQQDFREFTLRVDHSFSTKDQITFRYFYDHFTRNAVFDPDNLLIYSDGSTIKSQNFLGHWSHVFKPSVINDFRFSYAPENATRGPADNAIDVTDLGVKLPFQAPQKAIQQVRINGVFNFGDNPQASFIRNNLTWADDVSWVAGKHDLRFGGIIERSQVDLLNGFFQPAEFSFSSLPNFLAGKLTDYSGNLAFRQGAGEFKNNRNTFIGLYIQDNFRFTRRLMFNLGLRWEPALPWREIKGRQEQFRLPDLIARRRSTQFPNAPPGVFFPGDEGVPEDGVRPNYTSFAPRFGFAYDVFGDSKTSIRGGFGIFYDTRIPGIINNRFADLTPFSPQFVLNTGVVNPGTFADPLCTLPATQTLQNCTNQSANYPFPFTYPPDKNIQFGLGTFVLSWDPVNKYQPPTVYNWNLTIERQLPENVLVRAAYVGSHSSHLTETLNLNPRPVGTTSSTPTRLNAIAGSPLFSTVQQDLQDINASYNSMQLSLEKRMSRGFMILANYTWSKSLDDLPPRAGVTGFDTSSALPWDDPNRHRFDYGPSEFDHTQRFVASWIWQLPDLKDKNSVLKAFFGDWQLSGLVQAQTGRPMSVTQGSDISGTGIGQDRGSFTGVDPYLSGPCAGVASCKLWLNPAAFKLATDPSVKNTFGNVGKGSLRFPGYYAWDMGISKVFALTERYKIQLRGEFFNLFNQVNFLSDEGTVNNFSTVSNGNFGRLRTAMDPRVGQLALKFIF